VAVLYLFTNAVPPPLHKCSPLPLPAASLYVWLPNQQHYSMSGCLSRVVYPYQRNLPRNDFRSRDNMLINGIPTCLLYKAFVLKISWKQPRATLNCSRLKLIKIMFHNFEDKQWHPLACLAYKPSLNLLLKLLVETDYRLNKMLGLEWSG